MESVTPQRGIEAALAAALGDDLDAALDAKATAFWAGAETLAPPWPSEATPLAPLVKAPGQLAARLAFVALVEARDGPRLQKSLVPGARLVSRQGDLWRWDGLTVRAGSPRAAQARLEQKARLADVEALIEAAGPRAASAKTRYAAAAEHLAVCEAAVRQARDAATRADGETLARREALASLERDGARREAQLQSLAETAARFESERGEAQQALEAIEAEAVDAPPGENLTASLDAARLAAQTARSASTAASAALDAATRELEQTRHQLATSPAETLLWRGRAKLASERQTSLALPRRSSAPAPQKVSAICVPKPRALAVCASTRAATRELEQTTGISWRHLQAETLLWRRRAKLASERQTSPGAQPAARLSRPLSPRRPRRSKRRAVARR